MGDYEGPVQKFIIEGLQSDVTTIANEYDREMNCDFNQYLVANQRMDKLPDQLLMFFAQKVNQLVGETNFENINDLTAAIQDLLIEYDEMWLNQHYTDKSNLRRQLTYFVQKSLPLKMTVDKLAPYITRAFLLNEPDKKTYFIILEKGLSIGYSPTGIQNGVAQAMVTVMQGPSLICTLKADQLDDLLSVINRVKMFLSETYEETLV